MSTDNSKHILITGGTGFIGRALCPHLQARGFKLIVLTRNPAKYKAQQSKDLYFVGSLDEIKDEVWIDGIINLAGEPLGEGRWSEERKKIFVTSRLELTDALVLLMKRLHQKPRLLSH